MDLNKIIQRARALLVTPRTEWPVIAAEPTTIQALYRDYIMILAAIPPVAQFVKLSILGTAWHGFRIYRLGAGPGLAAAIIQYMASLAALYLLSIIVETLAPNFAGESNRLQALKLVGYSYTASWIAGTALILPGLAGLIGIAGAVYSIYLLYLGLPSMMKVVPERAAGYTAIIVISGLVLSWIIAVLTGELTGVALSDAW
jgi:hypothetical protein